MTGDWAIVGVSALLLLGTLVALGVVYGAVLGLIATGEAAGLVSGGLAGAYLVFPMFGVELAFSRFGGSAPLAFVSQCLPLLLLGVVAAATEVALRFGLPRVTARPPFYLAFVVKLALATSVLMAIIGSLLSFDDADDLESFRAKVSSGDALAYVFFFVMVIGVVLLLRRRFLPGLDRVETVLARSWVRAAGTGAATFLALAAALALVVTVAGLVVGDSGMERLLLVLGAPAVGLNIGVAALVVAMGGSVEQVVGRGSDFPVDTEIGRHISLFQWGLPPGSDADSASLFLFVLLLLAPLALGWATYRCLERRRPRHERDVLRMGFASTVGFTLTSWAMSLFGRLTVGGASEELDGFGWVVLAPSPRSAFGFGLLWGAVGGLGAALLWARRYNIPWTILQASGDPARPAPAPPPAGAAQGSPPTAGIPSGGGTFAPPPPPPPSALVDGRPQLCAACGGSLHPGARFCDACGTVVGSPPTD